MPSICPPANPLSSVNTLQIDQLNAAQNKRRKVDRACDACRRRKTKCDGPKMPDNICTNCLQTHKSCTYVEASKPRGPPKAYVTGLEDRLERLEAILKQLRPDEDFTEDLGPPVVRGSWKNDGSLFKQANVASSSSSTTRNKGSQSSNISRYNEGSTRRGASPPPLADLASIRFTTHLPFNPESARPRPRPRIRSSRPQNHSDSVEDSTSSYEDSSETDALLEASEGGPTRLTLRKTEATIVAQQDNLRRFHGKSSAVSLVEATRQFKQMHFLDSMEANTSNGECVDAHTPPTQPRSTRREEVWRSPRWELEFEGLDVDSPELIPDVLKAFPPDDLANSLIAIYFDQINPQVPLLHRPTFERQWKQRLHHRNIWYACVCITIFANASRWSDDVRVLGLPEIKAEVEEIDWTKAGWSYYEVGVGIHRARRSLLYPPTLFEVQTFTLLAMFARGTTGPSVAWIFVSIGLRKAQDVGAHRRNVYQDKPSVDEELWKRAFWSLILFDRLGGANLGRGCSVNEEDFDLQEPLEVDDEYWEPEDPALAFKQPPGVPSSISAFNLFLRMTQILGFALKTIYVTNERKAFSGSFAADWRDEIISQINLAMKDWADSVPPHLRWSDEMDNPLFANQATTLYITYYLTQMIVYRPFVLGPKPSNSSASGRPTTTPPFPYPALSICTTAARSCARIIESQMRRGLTNIPGLCMVSHNSAGMLAWSVWDLKAQERALRANGTEDIKPPFAQRIDELLADIRIFINALEWAQSRWPVVAPLLKKLKQAMPTEESQTDGEPMNVQTPAEEREQAGVTTQLAEPRYARHSRGMVVERPWVQADTVNWPWSGSESQIQSGGLERVGTYRIDVDAGVEVHRARAGYNESSIPSHPFGKNPESHPAFPQKPCVARRTASSSSYTEDGDAWEAAPPPPRIRTHSMSMLSEGFGSVEAPLPYITSASRRTSYPTLRSRYQEDEDQSWSERCVGGGGVGGGGGGGVSRGPIGYDDNDMNVSTRETYTRPSAYQQGPGLGQRYEIVASQGQSAFDKRGFRDPEWPNHQSLSYQGYVRSTGQAQWQEHSKTHPLHAGGYGQLPSATSNSYKDHHNAR